MTRLTVVMPTKNRSFFLAKTLRYYARAGYSQTILIGDASDADEYARNEQLVQRYGRELAITRRKHPPDLSSHASLLRLLDEVATPYTVFCGDDDFLVPAQLERCVEFLQSHNDYNLACGRTAWLSVGRTTEGRMRIERLVAGPHKSIESDVPSRRVVDWAYPTVSINSFCVQRSDNLRSTLRRATEMCLDASPGHQPLYEMAWDVLSLIHGKQVALPGLYHVMLRHGEKSQGVDAFGKLTRWNWSQEVTAMVEWWASEIVKREDIGYAAAQSVARAVFFSWVIPYTTRYRDRRLRENGFMAERDLSRSTLRQLVGDVPGVRRLLSLARERFQKDHMSLAAFLSPRSMYHRDFMPIYRVLMEPEVWSGDVLLNPVLGDAR